MKRLVVGVMMGAALGAGIAFLVKADEETREHLLEKTDELAAGRTNPLRLMQQNLQAQRERLRDAIEVGKRVAEDRQHELWAELELPEPTVKSGGQENPSL